MIGDAPGRLARSGSFALLENYEAKTGGAPISTMSPGILATSTSRRPRPRRCCSTSMPECRRSRRPAEEAAARLKESVPAEESYFSSFSFTSSVASRVFLAAFSTAVSSPCLI